MNTTTDVTGTPQLPEWYCDQCGARYFGPGTCSNQHPPNELKQDLTTNAPPTDPTPVPDPVPPVVVPPVAEPTPEPVPDVTVTVPAPEPPADTVAVPRDALRALVDQLRGFLGE